MQSNAKTPEEYISELPENRKDAMKKLREVFVKNLPNGFEETVIYGMIGYVVPHSIYPKGYHVTPSTPLPFVSIASQKNHIAVYHSGIYTMPEILKWFVQKYEEQVTGKLDMGKSCIRFKNPEKIPFNLFAELAGKISVQEWIDRYESVLKAK